MKKAVIVLVLLLVGAKFGIDFLFSDQFQDYGDRTKATWTCEVNMVLGEFFTVFSNYSRATVMFQKIIDRCPDTPVGQKAEFEIAKSFESQGLRNDAVAAYERYAEKYPGTRRARLAARAAGILKIS